VDLATESMPLAQPLTRTDVIRCSRDTVLFEDYSVLNHEGATWQWSFSPAPTYISDVNSRSPKVVFSANGPYDVTLTVTDLAGNTDTKTVESMIVVDSQCEPEAGRGHSMRLTANGDIAQTPDFGLENIEEFTMSVWVKPEAIQNIYTGIIISDNSACGLNFRNNNEIGFHWDNSQWWWDSGLFAPVGEWTHLALVITPSETTIYVNGESSVNTANNPLVDMTSFKFGSYHGWGGRNYNGEMDELCLWDRALSSDEIRESRHLTRTGADSFSDGLLAYYQFNEIGESEVLDKVGSRHAQMNAGAFLQASNAPIGGGLSDRLVLSASGVYAFPDTQTEITLSSGVGARDVVVSRWDTNDVEAPDGEELVSNVWLINNYGDEFNTASTIRLSTLGGVYSGSASDSRLLSRPQNAGEGEWTERCSAATKTLSQFTFDSSCGFVDSGQFTIIAPASCPGDLDGDGEVNVNDFILFNSAFGTSCSPCNADLDGDGLVGVNDFLFLNSFFGSTCN